MKIAYSEGSMTADEILKYLCLTGQDVAIMRQMVANLEAAKKAQSLGISVTDQELQQFADSFRSARGLASAQTTAAFLENAGLDEDDLEKFCETSVLNAKVKEQLAGASAVEEFFFANRKEFDTVRISIISVVDENLAKELALRIEEDEEDFHQLARQYSADQATRHVGGYLGEFPRQSFPADLSAKLFAASAGQVLGPFPQGELYRLILVEEVKQAQLDEETKARIKDIIFEQWLSQYLDRGVRISR